jgi:hypothetical protein
MFRVKTEQPSFLRLARKPNLDNETAYTICRLIDAVGWEIKGKNWNWDWLNGKRGRYRSLIDTSIVESAWRLLGQKVWLSLQIH